MKVHSYLHKTLQKISDYLQSQGWLSFFLLTICPNWWYMAKVKSWPIHIFIMLNTPTSLTEMPSISINDFIDIT